MSDLIKTNYNYFYIKNYTGMFSTSSYSLPITPFTFIPTGITDIGNQYSNKKLLWDFGDNTTSKSVTATHSYSLPGTYTITLYLIDALGNGVVDSYKQTVDVYDIVPDNFVVTTLSYWANISSHFDNYFTITRFNSWRNYDKFIVDGYKFNLYGKNTNAPLLDVDVYNKEIYSHLLPYAGFFQKTWNTYINDYEKIPVNSVITTSTELYYKLSGSNIIKCDSTDVGSCFAGTSGTADVYFIDDFSPENRCDTLSACESRNANIFISQDNINLSDYTLDQGNLDNTLPKSKYQIIQQIPKNVFYATIPQNDIGQISFTSNGIESFTIDSNQFTGTQIPFVIRLQDSNNYPAKYLPVLTLINNNSALSAGNIKISLLSAGVTVGNATITADFDNLTAKSIYGGYFKGYIECPIECNNVYLQASVLYNSITGRSVNLFLLQPESRYIHSIQPLSGGYSTSTISTSTIFTSTTGAAAVAVIPETGSVWIVDADRDIIVKYNNTGTLLSSFNLSAMQLSAGGTVNLLGSLSSAAPSYIALDGNYNAWVTLFDAVSTIKINQLTGKIDAVAIPPFANTYYGDLSGSYFTLSGFANDNSLTPSCVDTDTQNNIWVTYSNPISSYIIKYSTTGTVLSTITVDFGYSADALVVDKNDNIWVVYKNYINSTLTLNECNDSVYYINGKTGDKTQIPICGYIGDITLDYDSNVWLTKNKNVVVKISPDCIKTVLTYPISSSPNNTTTYLTDIEGIGGVDVNSVLLVSSADRRVYNFNSTITTSFAVTALPDLNVNSGENKLFAVGDWTGVRWMTKYRSTVPSLVVNSDTFNVYLSTGKYSIGKINENVDFTEMYKSYIFQETLLENNTMFTDFIGSIVGNIESNPNTLGKRVYEKISNFVDNTYNPQTCNIPALVSLYQQFGQNTTQFDKSQFSYPADLARLIDLFSIKQSKLWGGRNKFAENYNKRGTVNSDTYGINLGDKLNFYTTILTAGSAAVPIVAYEKFSETYKLLNTDVLSGNHTTFRNSTTQTYELSTYSNYWGWNLVLPSDYTLDEINNSYIFYTYIPTQANNQLEGIINWEDTLTTISENLSTRPDWQNVMENMLTYQLYKGMQVFTS